jgi:hypothetical protein
MNAIQKTKILCSIILLIVFFGACSTKKQMTSSSSTAVAVDTATHQTAFQSLKPKPYYYPNFRYHLNNIPTPKPKAITTKDLYEFAFENLKAMLEEKDSVDFEKAIFITENVYYRNRVKYDDYLRVLDHHAKRINALIDANDKSASIDFKVYANFRERGLSYTSLRYTESEKRELYRKALTNWAIFTYLTDTLSFSKKEHLPFAYQIDDPFGMDNWSNSQVLHLLGSMEKKGNCFALVALYKIFANRLKSEAYICTAPQHIYLQHRDEKGDFYNLELATKTYPSDGTLMTLTFTHKEAIMSGISLRRLKTEKQNIVLCLVNLGKSYEHKFETREDDFMLKCAELALQYDSLNLNAMLLKQQVLEERVMKFAITDTISSIAVLQDNATFKQLEKHTLHLFDKGYHQMPLYMQEIILSKLRQDNKPLVIKDRTPNPFTSIKVPAKNRRYSTLSGGLYEEVHAPKQLEEYGYFVLDTKNRKLVKFAENTNKELLIDPVVFAWSVDPMAHERTSWTPYNAFRNNPILNIDPTGALDTKYEDEAGNEIANTNDGSDAVVVVPKDKLENFKENVKHADKAIKDSKGWNDYWKEEFIGFKLSDQQEGLLHQLNSDWSRKNAIEFWKNPTTENALAFSFSEALSQWTNPVLVIGGLSAGVSGLKPSPKKSAPRPSPNFRTPTNPAQAPPTKVPDGLQLRVMGPTQQYPQGYWVLEKPQANGGMQKINPSTLKPGPEWDTHVPLPAKK